MGGAPAHLPIPILCSRCGVLTRLGMIHGVQTALPLTPSSPLQGSPPSLKAMKRPWGFRPGSHLSARLYRQNVTSVLPAHFFFPLVGPSNCYQQTRVLEFTTREESSGPGWHTMNCQSSSGCHGRTESVGDETCLGLVAG